MNVKEIVILLTERKAELAAECLQLDRALAALQPVGSVATPPHWTRDRRRVASPPLKQPKATGKTAAGLPANHQGTLRCEACGRTDFETPMSRGQHARWCTGKPAVAETARKPGLAIRGVADRPQASDGVPCLQCGKRFPNAREVSAHQTAEHFTGDAAMSRRA